MINIALVLIHKAEIIIRNEGRIHGKRRHRLKRRHKIHDAITVLIVVGTVAQQKQILDSMARIAVEIKHSAEVTDSRNVLCATGELIVNLFWSGDEDVQFGVDAIVNRLDTFSLRNKIRIRQDDEIHVTDTMKVLIVDLSDGFCRLIGAPIESNELVFVVTHHLEAEGGTIELTFHHRRISRVGDIPNLSLLRSARQTILIGLVGE